MDKTEQKVFVVEFTKSASDIVENILGVRDNLTQAKQLAVAKLNEVIKDNLIPIEECSINVDKDEAKSQWYVKLFNIDSDGCIISGGFEYAITIHELIMPISTGYWKD